MFPADRIRRRVAAVVAAMLLVGLLPATVFAATPVAGNDNASMPVNAPATTIDVLGNDTGSPPLTIDPVLAVAPTHGTVVVAGDGSSLTYQPDTDFHGTDTFDYTVTDGVATDNGTVTVDVNSPPVAVDDPGTACQPAGGPLGGGFPVPEDYISPSPPAGYFAWFGNCALLHNDTDADGDSLTWQIVTQPAHGTVLKVDEEVFGYKPDHDYSATDHGLPATAFDTFTYKACDAVACSAPATMKIWVAPINDAPTFTPGAAIVTVGEDSGPYTAPWATNPIPGPPSESWQVVHFETDTNFNGVPNLFTVPPAIDSTGKLTFTPAPDQFGIVFVTVRAKDDGGLEDWGLTGQTQPHDTSGDVTFQLVVNADAVTAVNDTETIAEDQLPSPVTMDVLANDTVPAGATITAVTQGTLGAVTIAPDGLSVRYAPNPNANGSDTFTYKLDDGAGSVDTGTVQVTITPVNDVPVVLDDTLNVGRNAPATAVGVLANDHDIDTGDTLTIIAKTDGLKGTVVITGGGTDLTYQPNTDATGADSFTYTASDGHGGDVVGTVSVIIAEGSLPVANDDSATMLEDAAATVIPVLGNDSDPDLTDVLTITGKTNGAKGTVTLTSATTLTYKPNANANGSDSFTYTINDGHGGSATGTVDVTITPVDDAPIARNDTTLSVPESAGPRALAVLANDIEYDGETLHITAKTNGAHGTVAITGGGTGLTYDPNQLYSGKDGFTYTISDGHHSSTATVVLTVVADTVKPVATAPVQTFYNQTSGASSVKVKIAWGGSDTGGTGVKSYKLQVSVNGHAYTTITSATTATSTTRTLSINSTYRFRVRATDRQGNVGYYAYGPTFKVIRYQNTSSTAHYLGAWTTSSNSSALGGSHRYTSAAGASVSFTGSVRNIAWMATKTTTSGSAQVWIDGTLAATINLRASKTLYKQLVYHRDFGALGTHTIEIRSLGGGRVYFDAVAVLQ